MRKLFLYLVFLVTIDSAINAQIKINTIFDIGGSKTFIYYKDTLQRINDYNCLNFRIGGAFEYFFIKQLAIGTDLCFTKSGYKSFLNDYSRNYNYLEIPIYAKIVPVKFFSIWAGYSYKMYLFSLYNIPNDGLKIIRNKDCSKYVLNFNWGVDFRIFKQIQIGFNYYKEITPNYYFLECIEKNKGILFSFKYCIYNQQKQKKTFNILVTN